MRLRPATIVGMHRSIASTDGAYVRRFGPLHALASGDRLRAKVLLLCSDGFSTRWSNEEAATDWTRWWAYITDRPWVEYQAGWHEPIPPAERFRLASLIADAGSPQDALALLERGRPQHDAPAALLGTLLHRLGRYEAALACWQAASQAAPPDNIHAVIGCAQACINLGRWADAIAWLHSRRPQRTNPAELRASWAHAMARARAHAGRNDLPLLTRRVRLLSLVFDALDPRVLSARADLAEALWARGRYTEAHSEAHFVAMQLRRIYGPHHVRSRYAVLLEAVFLGDAGNVSDALTALDALFASAAARGEHAQPFAGWAALHAGRFRLQVSAPSAERDIDRAWTALVGDADAPSRDRARLEILRARAERRPAADLLKLARRTAAQLGAHHPVTVEAWNAVYLREPTLRNLLRAASVTRRALPREHPARASLRTAWRRAHRRISPFHPPPTLSD